MKKKQLRLLLPLCILLLCCLAGILCFFRSRAQETFLQLSELNAKEEKDTAVNPYFDLSVPTYITRLQDTYFLVDCYHDEIICSDSLSRPLNEWDVMTDEISRGHTMPVTERSIWRTIRKTTGSWCLKKKTGNSSTPRLFPISASGPIISFMMRKPAVFMSSAP